MGRLSFCREVDAVGAGAAILGMILMTAGVAELADARDSKSRALHCA
jgi:hypothetical protein